MSNATADNTRLVTGNPIDAKPRREVVVSLETLNVILTDHANAERLLDSWFGK